MPLVSTGAAFPSLVEEESVIHWLPWSVVNSLLQLQMAQGSFKRIPQDFWRIRIII